MDHLATSQRPPMCCYTLSFIIQRISISCQSHGDERFIESDVSFSQPFLFTHRQGPLLGFVGTTPPLTCLSCLITEYLKKFSQSLSYASLTFLLPVEDDFVAPLFGLTVLYVRAPTRRGVRMALPVCRHLR